MEKINIAELLKDCPKGMELDCTMYENVYFIGLVEDTLIEYPILVNICDDDGEHPMRLTKEGYWSPSSHGKCVIFPKGKTTWEGFKRPFVDGDVISYLDSIAIFKEWGDATLFRTYVTAYLHGDSTIDVAIPLFGKSIRREARLATEEEKQKLFDAIKANSYRWNPETKTLEKLIKPKFKMGDRIILKDNPYNIPSIRIKAVTKKNQYILESGSFLYINSADEKYVLEDKFDITTLVPFESRVLIRDYNYEEWKASFWGYLTNNFYGFNYDTVRGNYKQCIPYEGNEHLLGTTDDCDEYFKTWK